MTDRQRQRLIFAIVFVAGIGTAVGLFSYAFRQNLLYFYSPTQVAAGDAPAGHAFRVGGLVMKGSIKHDGLTTHFVVTDTAKTIPVVYTGVLPDLFREGQGVVAEGRINSHGVFVATQVLAKHDSRYMPPQVARALKAARQDHTRRTATTVARK